MATSFTPSDLAKLTNRAKKLTPHDLHSLIENPANAPAALKLTVTDLQSLQSLATTKLAAIAARPTPLPGCCCCCVRGACCCCCADVTVRPA